MTPDPAPMFLASLNNEYVKYGLMVVTAPWWLPFVKALWRELNSSLRDEGGLFGRPPTAQELAQMNREEGVFVTSLVNEPRPDRPRGRGERSTQAAPAPGRGARAAAPAREMSVRKRGFRNR